VIKVQRPNVAQIIAIDLDIMRDLAVLMERYLKGLYVLNPTGVVKEFTDNIRRELDFRIEANNMRRFARNFADTPWVHVPRIFEEHCCNQKILIMEYIDGIQISDLGRLQKEGYDIKLVAQRGVDVSFRSALEHGFFHADPHPGNLLVLPDNVLCLLDFGMMGTLSVRYRERLGKLLYFMSNGDEKRTARALLQLIETTEVVDAETLELDVANIIQEFSGTNISEAHLGNMFFRLLRLLQQRRARFPVHMVWLFKSIATLEDLARKMDPGFQLIRAARPYARRLILKDLNPLHQSQETYFSALDSLNFLRDLPYDAGIVLDQLKKGRVKIEFEHLGLEPLRQTLHQITHHIALTLLLAAVLISSAIIVLAGVPPLVGSMPIIGLVGFCISGVLAVLVIISLLIR
jgi:ubiquinone biosynthesis protein